MKRVRRFTGGARRLFATLAIVLVVTPAAIAAPWTLKLAESVVLPVREVRLADLVTVPVPAVAAELVVTGPGRPGSTVSVDRRRLLRMLVANGLAAEVRCAGAERCRVEFVGSPLASSEVVTWLQSELKQWLPPAPLEAPPTWLEVELSLPAMARTGDCRFELVEPRRLRAGRNLVPLRIVDTGGGRRLTAMVLCHAFGEIARATREFARNEELKPDLFQWEWRDLCLLEAALVSGRESLAGRSASRRIASGGLLRRADMKETPLVLAGEPVELRLRRGSVTVSVPALARQEGRRGQIITVRNSLSGKLVTGRVVASGVVELRR